MNSFSSLFASKNRKVQFEAQIKFDCLTDVPLIDGQFFIKWKIRNTLNEYTGRTHSVAIKDHTVIWQTTIQAKVNLLIGKDGVLIPCYLRVSIKKETHGGKKSETIGKIDVDLSEYAGSDFHTRQYLLQQSKMNSSLKVSVEMKQLQGDPLFKIPETSRTQTSGLKSFFNSDIPIGSLGTDLNKGEGGKENFYFNRETLSFTNLLNAGDDLATNPKMLIDEIFSNLEKGIDISEKYGNYNE